VDGKANARHTAGMSIRVRPATIADAALLSEFGAATFRDTFEGENTPDDMARYLSEAFTPEQQAEEIGDAGGTVLLAESDANGGELVGYVHLVSGPTPPAVHGPEPLELKRLYVARAWHGRRVAQALMDAALDAARARGDATMWLGVWERNPRAQRFYRQWGFEKVGEHVFRVGADPQNDFVMSRRL